MRFSSAAFSCNSSSRHLGRQVSGGISIITGEKGRKKGGKKGGRWWEFPTVHSRRGSHLDPFSSSCCASLYCGSCPLLRVPVSCSHWLRPGPQLLSNLGRRLMGTGTLSVYPGESEGEVGRQGREKLPSQRQNAGRAGRRHSTTGRKKAKALGQPAEEGRRFLSMASCRRRPGRWIKGWPPNRGRHARGHFWILALQN